MVTRASPESPLAEPTASQTAWWPGLGAVAVLAASLVVAREIWERLILGGGPFHWDEATHALLGLLIAEDLRHHDGFGLLYDTYRQVTWTPLHSWLVGGTFAVVGASRETARIVSLAAFVVLAQTTYWAGWFLLERRRELAGAIAALFVLTSPFLAANAAQCMIEVPGLTLLTAVALLYFALPWEASRTAQLLLGCTLAATYFMKSNYGVLIVLALVTDLWIANDLRIGFVWRYRYVWLPLLVTLTAWFLYPAKLWTSWRVLVNQPVSPRGGGSFAGLLYYPRAVLTLAGSVPALVIMLLALAAACGPRARASKIRFLTILVVLQMLLAEFHHTKAGRHILPIAPALALLSGWLFAREWSGSRGRLRGGLLAVLVALHLSTLVVRGSGIPAGMPLSGAPNVAAYVASLDRDHRPVLFLGTRDVSSPVPPELDWQLIVDHGVLKASRAGALGEIGRGQAVRALGDKLLVPAWVHQGIERVTRRSTDTVFSRSLYLDLPPGAPQSGSLLEIEVFLHGTMAIDSYGAVVLITSSSSNAHYPADAIVPALERAGFHQISRCSFEGKTQVDLFTPSSRAKPGALEGGPAGLRRPPVAVGRVPETTGHVG